MKRTWRRASALAAVTMLAACNGGNEPQPPAAPRPKVLEADIRYTSFGVPHVRANDFAGLGYGVARAYLKDNFCVLAEQMVTVNGERSKYFGGDGTALVSHVPIKNRESDFFFKSYFDEPALVAALDQNPAEVRELLQGYLVGFNDHLARTGTAALPAACRNQPWVRPMQMRDIARFMAEKATLGSGGGFARAIFNAQPPGTLAARAPALPDRLNRDVVLAQLHPNSAGRAASNSYAIGKDGTGTGTGMLLGNPHFPYADSARFFELQMTVPGRYDVYGVITGDFPIILIGFDNDKAWTHTNSNGQRHTFMELTLVPGKPTRYVFDGQEREMTSKAVSIEVKGANGEITTETRTLYSSHHGPIVAVNSPVPGGVNLSWSAGTAYAMRDVNRLNVDLARHWLKIGQAKSAGEIKQVLDSTGASPFLNTIAADRGGNALYADIGSLPNVPASKMRSIADGGCVKGKTAQVVLGLFQIPILDGARVACDWDSDPAAPRAGAMPTAQQPSVIRTDFVSNSNNSAWLPNPASPQENFSPIMGGIRTELTLRQRLALDQVAARLSGADGLSPQPKFHSTETLRAILYQNRLLGAELVVDRLVTACAELGTPARVQTAAGEVDITQACAILANWDKRANLDSIGAVLFREFFRTARGIPGLWQVPFDANDPVRTPRDLNTANPAVRAKLLETLGTTVKNLAAANLDITKPLGELQRVSFAGKSIALAGGDEFEGVFNKLTMTAPVPGVGYTQVAVGTTYVQAVTWINGNVSAEGVLAYGQSADPASPHYTDQTEQLFTQKKFKRLPFSEADIVADPNFRTERVQVVLP